MRAEEVGGGSLHRGGVEGPATVPDIGGEERRADAVGCFLIGAALEDAVLVGFAAGPVAGVEGFGDSFGAEDADARWEGAVEGAEEVFGGDCGFEREGCDLREGVDAGVSAAGALREDSFSGEVVERGGEGALDGREVRLDLPAVEGRAVVAEG